MSRGVPPMDQKLRRYPVSAINSFVTPRPGPRRRFDGPAYRDPEGLVGTGATKAEAIANLLQQKEERE